jgi:hypothetical protein
MRRFIGPVIVPAARGPNIGSHARIFAGRRATLAIAVASVLVACGLNEPTDVANPAVTAGASGSVAGAPVAGAGTAGASAAGSGTAGTPDAPATFTELYNTTLSSCKNVLCHGGPTDGPGVGLNMRTRDDAYKALVGIMASDNGDCAGSGLVRVVPSDPDASLLIMKIARMPPCGGQMPPGGSLIAEQIDPVRAWIAAGAPDN